MENIKLGGSFFCPRCQCTHSSAITCSEVQAMQQRDAEFWANLRETTEEEKAMLTQPLFTLTAEEVEMVKNTLEGLKTLSIAIRKAYNIGMNKNDDPEDIDFIADNLLTRIKQWQDENHIS